MLTSSDVERLLDGEGLIEALDHVHRALATGRAVQPAPAPLRYPADAAPDAPAVISTATEALTSMAMKLMAKG